MPLGFSGGNWLSQMGERYGDKLAKGIVQTGAIIEENLMKMQTNRQLTGLGQSLSQLNPQSAEYPNQLIELGTAFPMAMQDRRGQFLMSIGAKANAEWQAQERAKAQSQLTFDRQKTMLGLRNQNRTNNEVDLLGAGLPANEAPQAAAVQSAPPNANMFALRNAGLPGIGAAMDLSAAPQTEPATPQPAAPAMDGTSALMGMSGGLGDAAPAPLPKTSSANRAALRETDSLLGRALGPLREAQQLTGKKPTQAQLASAVAAEKRAEQSRLMQEDRQRQSEEMTQKKAESDAVKAARKAAEDEAKAERKDTLKNLGDHRRTAVSAVTRAAKAFEDSFNAEEESGNNEEYFRLRKRLQSEVTLAQKELEGIDAEIATLLKADTSSQPASRPALKYNPATRRLE